MSLSSTTNKVIYNGNGATSVWPFSFPVLDTGHLAAVFTDGAGLETVLSPSLYGVAGIGDPEGGSVTFPLSGNPIAVGTKLTLLRTVPYTQTTVLSNQGGYYPEVVERRFDQIYMALQQLEERLGRVSLYSVSDPATEQANLALIQQLQPMNILSAPGDLLTRDGSSYKRLTRGAAGQFLGINGADLAWAIPSQPVAPQGRLTLVSGEPVMTADQMGKTSMFYTPYVGANLPIHDGFAFVPTAFAERSNDLTQSSIGKAGPAPAGPHQVIDAFVWNDSGTLRLTRGPCWKRSATVAITMAAPAVFTWVGHNLRDGGTLRLSTTGALYTGLAAATEYFVTKVDADTFKLSSSLVNQISGTFINTSGSQSGVHTAEAYTIERGTGAGSSELERVGGIWVNKHDITNGPAAQRGTYVGTVYCNASSQIDYKFGGYAVGGGEAIIGVWNAYNRVEVSTYTGSSTNTWGQAAGWAAAESSTTWRCTLVRGLNEDAVRGLLQVFATTSSGVPAAGVGLNRTTGAEHSAAASFDGSGGVAVGSYRGLPGLGLHALCFNTYGGVNVTFYGDNGGSGGVGGTGSQISAGHVDLRA